MSKSESKVIIERASFGLKFSLSWKNLIYEVETGQIKDNKKETKRIINNSTGYANSSECTAIMGPSGCGKTSLLNYLTDRIEFPKNSIHSGELYIESQPKKTSDIATIASYVMQDDLLFDILTPTETLKFVSKLRRPLSEKEHDAIVEELIEELKLTKCKDTRIGNENVKGLSGGERKRVSIGIEIISNPTILFLDEPTSGLDSQTSFIVIDFLKYLAKKKNLLVLFTIHQPSSNIVSLFDKLILMNKGQCVYQGPTLDVIEYFDSIGFPLGLKANPADAFMHKLEEQNSRFQNNKEEEINEKALTEIYKERLEQKIENDINTILNKNGDIYLRPKDLLSSGFCNEFRILSYRALLNLIRNPNLIMIRVVMVLIFSFIACSIFYFMPDNQSGVYSRTGFIFFFTVNNFMTIVFSAVLAFPVERGVFIREYANKLYGVSSYYISKNLVELPLGLLVTFFYGVITYYIVGLRGDAQYFFTFLCIFVVLAFHAQSLGLCFGAIFSNLNTAVIITQFSVLPFFLFSGVLINQVNMPVWLAWIRFFSPFRYAIEAGLRNEFDGNTLFPPMYSPVTTLNLDIGMWACVGIMAAWGFGLRILGGMFLKLLVRKTG